MKKALLTVSVITALASLSVQARPSGIYDPRALGMGGVGVTTATARNASFFNPAALAATREDEDFALNLTLAVRAADPDKLADDIEDVEDAGNEVSDALDALNSSITTINNGITNATLTEADVRQGSSSAARSSTAITNFNNELQKVNRKTVDLTGFGGLIIAIPSKNFGIGLYASGRADAGARFNYSSSDAAMLTGYAGDATTISTTLDGCATTPLACDSAAVTTLRDQITDANGDLNNLQSTFDARGIVVSEVGISLARRFPEYGNIDIGITPKALKVKTFNYAISAQDTEFDSKTGQLDASAFSFDVGVTKTYGESYKTGIVIKNVLGKKFALANSTDEIKIKPEARLGLSHHTNWTTIGLDLDLMKNEGLGNGFSKDTQFLGVGAELDVWLLQLRLGYRHDLSGNYDGMPSVGVGLNLFGLHLDVGAAGNAKEVAASAQLGLNF